jgi:hypothetical protein
MKTADFFLEKSESFNKELKEIKLVPYDTGSTTSDIYKDIINRENSEFTEQGKFLEDIKFQMRLMFSEFDNGFLFNEKMDKEYKNISIAKSFSSHQPFIDHLIKTNELFIKHLKDYRIEVNEKS